jgi:hypothetical protein
MLVTRAAIPGVLLSAVIAFGQANAPARKLTFNGRPLTREQQVKLETMERAYGARLPDAAYWYDNRSGAMGAWNGPGVVVLPANCSGGGTRVFVNGRELHPIDVAVLSQLGPVYPGRYWVDSNGDYGYENGPRTGNLVALAMAARGQAQGQRRVYSPGELSGVIVNSAGACTNLGCYYPSR